MLFLCQRSILGGLILWIALILVGGLYFCSPALAEDPGEIDSPTGTYGVIAVTDLSSDFSIEVENLTDASYYAVFRYGTIIGNIVPINETVRSIPQMFSNPELITLRFYSDASVVNLVAQASLDSSGKLIINTTDLDHCFIATAAYGSKYKTPVTVLRQFRDQFLLSCSLGQSLVKAYYQHSPPVARVIAAHKGLKLAVRLLLAPACNCQVKMNKK